MTPPKPKTEDSTPIPLPFIEHGYRVVENSFSLSGTIQHPEAQPPYAYTSHAEPRVFVVVAFTDGYGVTPADGERTKTWANKLKLAQAFDITDVEDLGDADTLGELIEVLRDRLRKELGQLPVDDALNDDPKAKKRAS